MDSLGTLGDIARENARFAEQAVNRVRIAARQAGIEMGLDPIDLDRIPILGTSRNVIRPGITTIVTKIAEGATPLTVIEEHAEGIAKYLIGSSNVGRGKMLGWLRDTEQKTGRKILPDAFDTASPTADQEIIEGWSYLARANATGRVADSALPQPVKSFFRAFKEAIHASLKIAADFIRVRGISIPFPKDIMDSHLNDLPFPCESGWIP